MPSILDRYDREAQHRRRRRRERAFPLMNDIEQDALSTQLANVGLSTLSYVGETLDKPGRAVRGLLSGQGPEALLNLIPYSDKMGITDPGNAPTGREMLENLGIAGPNTSEGLFGTGLDWGDIGGFATEVALDPLTYLTLGASAATKTGKVAKAAGTFPKRTIIDPKTGAVILGKREAKRMTPRQISGRIHDTGPESLDYTRRFLKAAKAQGYGRAARKSMFNEEILGGSFGMFGKTMNLPGAMSRAKWLDQADANLRFGTVGRSAGSAFDAPSMGLGSRAGQAVIGPETFDDYATINAERRIEKHGLEETLRDGKWNLDNPDHITEIEGSLRLGVEGLPMPDAATPEMTASLRAVVDHMKPVYEKMVARAEKDGTPRSVLQDIIRDTTKAMNEHTGRRIGYSSRGPLDPYAGSFSKFDRDQTRLQRRTDRHFLEKRAFRGFSQGTRGIVDALADPRLAKNSELELIDRAQILGEEYMGWLPQEESAWARYNKMSEVDVLRLDEVEQGIRENVLEKWDSITKMASKVNRYELGSNPFDKPILESFMERQIIADQVHSSTENAKKLFALTSRLGGDDAGKTLADALKEVKVTGKNGIPSAVRSIARWGDMDSQDAVMEFLQKYGNDVEPRDFDGIEKGVSDVINDALAKDVQVAEIKEEIKRLKSLMDDPKSFRLMDAVNDGWITAEEALSSKSAKDFFKKEVDTDLAKFRVTKDILKDATRLRSHWESPEEMGVVLGAFDAFTNAFKAGVTTMFPGFHARNYYSEFWNNIVAQGYDPRYGLMNPMRYVQPYLDARTVMRGGTIKDLSKLPQFKGLTDAQATRRLAAVAAGHEAVGTGRITEILGDVPGLTRAANVPGRRFQSLVSSVKGSLKGSKKTPVWVQQLRGVPKDELADQFMVAAGRGVGEEVETVSRLATVIAKVRQGYNFKEAADVSKFAHVDYNRLTQFERNVMKRVVPFYAWHRNQIPYQIKKLIERPGGPVAQATRAANLSRTNEFVPEWASSGMSVKLSENPETGDRTFLGGIDLPHEAAFEMLSLGPNLDQALRKTGTSMASLLHPIPKGIGEYLTDTSLFRKGTPLSEMDPPLGRAVSNIGATMGLDIDPRGLRNFHGGQAMEHALMTSPIARSATTVRKLFDPRKTALEKSINLLSGARISTVGANTERQALMEQIEDMMQGSAGLKTFVQPYASDKSVMSPENIELMRLYQTLVNQKRKQRAKEKKKQEK